MGRRRAELLDVAVLVVDLARVPGEGVATVVDRDLTHLLEELVLVGGAHQRPRAS